MTALHQMGHDSRNLLGELPGFGGAVVSPVNDLPLVVQSQVSEFQSVSFRFVLDPQLYFPHTQRANLRLWPYFPADFDTADASDDWWFGVGAQILSTANDLGIREVCTPVSVPGIFADDFYRSTVDRGNRLAASAGQTRTLQTVLVRFDELADPQRPLAIGSIVSSTSCGGIYLVLCSEHTPRLEYAQSDALKGAMRLISALVTAGLEVTIPFCGSEVVLWKAAGAQRCATGKFFNLRRFTPGRWDDPNGGGGQLPYWFEESLLAFLRQGDLARIRNRDLFPLSAVNTFGQGILAQLDADPSRAWLGASWRQFMAWFAEVDRRVDEGLDVDALVATAEANWETVRDARPILLMDEPKNDGRWLRPWRIALAEFAGST